MSLLERHLVRRSVMDVGLTKSGRSHPLHYFTGSIIFLVSYCGAVLMVKQLFL